MKLEVTATRRALIKGADLYHRDIIFDQIEPAHGDFLCHATNYRARNAEGHPVGKEYGHAPPFAHCVGVVDHMGRGYNPQALGTAVGAIADNEARSCRRQRSVGPEVRNENSCVCNHAGLRMLDSLQEAGRGAMLDLPGAVVTDARLACSDEGNQQNKYPRGSPRYSGDAGTAVCAVIIHQAILTSIGNRVVISEVVIRPFPAT